MTRRARAADRARARSQARSRARSRQDRLTKPRGSLGALEALVVELAGIQCRARPASRPAAALLFASDHPVARHGVSAYPPTVTAAMIGNIASGGAASAVLARHLGVALHVIDVGVATPYRVPRGAERAAAVVRERVADAPAGDLRVEDALSAPAFEATLACGRRAVARLPPATKVLILGELGIANTTPAAAVIARILRAAPALVVGPGTGLGEAGLARKRAVVRDALDRTRPWRGDAAGEASDALRRLGGRDLVALAGAMLAGAERGLAILVDGLVVSAAALAACGIAPRVRSSLVFAHRSAEPGHALALEALGATPLLSLRMRLGEATGALAALPLLDMACRVHVEMATFAEAGVPGRSDRDTEG